MKATIELTDKGKERLDILYNWLRKKRIKRLYLQRVKENTNPMTGLHVLIDDANDEWYSVNCLFGLGFLWSDTPEGHYHWKGLDKKFTKYCRKHGYE